MGAKSTRTLVNSELAVDVMSDGTVLLVTNTLTIPIPMEILDGKYSVDQLFNLGMQKREEIEKLVLDLWEEKEQEKLKVYQARSDALSGAITGAPRDMSWAGRALGK